MIAASSLATAPLIGIGIVERLGNLGGSAPLPGRGSGKDDLVPVAHGGKRGNGTGPSVPDAP